MFIAHLPAAYLAAQVIAPQVQRGLLTAVLVGSVAPDIDLIWFYLIDNGAVHHHNYYTHRPLLWGLLAGFGVALRRVDRGLLLAFAAGGLIHMLLDTVAGQIAWGWPISYWAPPLIVVSPTHSHWVLSFLFHWTFLVELAICASAMSLYLFRRRQK